MHFEQNFLDDLNAGMRTGLKWLAALFVAVLLLILSGCSTMAIQTPQFSAQYTRIGNQDLSGLRFEKDALGVTRVTLDKQSSDSDVLNVIRQLVAP